MTQRTITIVTSDRGAVTIPEPAWCTGRHPEGNLRGEISHQGQTLAVNVDTDKGPRRLVELLLWQDPFPSPSDPQGAQPYVAVQFLDGDYFGYDAPGLEGLAADLLEAAGAVRRFARQLAARAAEDEEGDGR